MSERFVKSPLNYMGGKYKILGTIMPIMNSSCPKTFWDVFAGGFNVGINANCGKILCNDQITYLIELFEYFRQKDFESIRQEVLERVNEFSLSKTNDAGYRSLRARYNTEPSPIDLFVLTCFSFNHQIRFNSKHEFNTPFGKERSSYNGSIENNLKNFIEALRSKDITFSTFDFRDLDYASLTKDDLAYFDPPYLISTGSYNDGKRGFKDWTEEEEKDLLHILDELNSRSVRFALSNVMHNKGLSNDLLIKWADQYRVHFIDNSFTNCSYHYKDRTSKTVEVLVTNF